MYKISFFKKILEKINDIRIFIKLNCKISYLPGGKIYALGGNNGMGRLSSCERYDPSANQWELVASMNWPHSDASAATLNGKIYIAGGYDGQTVLSYAEVYDVQANQWTYLPFMNEARSGVSLVAFKGCLYAIGGFNGYDRLSSGKIFKGSLIP